MDVKTFLEQVAYTAPSNIEDDEGQIYRSKYDGSYVTCVGQENNIKFLADREITEQLTHGVGFSPKDGKWYGWSHRAICGFGIGSTCKKGHSHYRASTPEELIDDHADFFLDISQECADRHRAECQILPGRSGIRILPTPLNLPVVKDTKSLFDVLEDPKEIGSLPVVDIHEDAYYTVSCGKGEWTAKTLEDAKQMAADFSEGVS